MANYNNKGSYNKNSYNKNQNSAPSVAKELSDLIIKNKSVSQTLLPENYALPGGYAQRIADGERSMSRTKLRKLYTPFKSLASELNLVSNQAYKKELYPKLCLTMPHIAYELNRKQISQDFYTLLHACIKHSETKADLETFIKFFEAIVAYTKKD